MHATMLSVTLYLLGTCAAFTSVAAVQEVHREGHRDHLDDVQLDAAGTRGRELLQTAVRQPNLTVIRRPDGQTGFAEVPEDQKRPLKIEFLNHLGRTRSVTLTPEVEAYIMDTLMPAAGNLLRRFLRVRCL